MEVTATAKYVRISPQKARIVVDQIKKMKPKEAIGTLGLINKKAAQPLKKVIASALANAKNNFNLDEKTLNFKEILVGEGIKFKRYRPISRGRARQILRRTSNIKVVLESTEEAKNRPIESAVVKKTRKGDEKVKIKKEKVSRRSHGSKS